MQPKAIIYCRNPFDGHVIPAERLDEFSDWQRVTFSSWSELKAVLGGLKREDCLFRYGMRCLIRRALTGRSRKDNSQPPASVCAPTLAFNVVE